MITNFYSRIKTTTDNQIGLLINGVELYSPSVFDESIYYGEIDNVRILNSGSGYDVINPPSIHILDDSGVNAEIIANARGILEEVIVISPGIGYSKKPNLSVIGGNSDNGIELETNLIQKSLTAQFIANDTYVASGTKILKFLNPHNFEDNEQIIYRSPELTPINNLIPDSSYYAGVVDESRIKVYKTKQDSIDKINPIAISVNVGIHSGLHEFATKEIKNVIDTVHIKTNGGYLYNRKVKIPSVEYFTDLEVNGISTTNNFIYAQNHNFREKDIIVYETTGTPISGISTISKYLISVLDENRFKLYDAGSDDIPDPDNYQNNISAPLNSIGTGTHIFKYDEIRIKVSSVSGISSTQQPVLAPIVIGEIDSLFLVNPGNGYGCKDIVDYHRRPEIKVGSDYVDEYGFRTDAVILPIIIDGKIVAVQILNSGNNYENDVELIVSGDGKYAKLSPIIVDGKISGVNIISSGIGYVPGKTSIIVKRRGTGAKFIANITKWTIDQYKKNEQIIKQSSGEGITIPSRNNKGSLQFINFYPPKNLLDKINDSGNKSSGIIGWAYDGNPIYGPFIKINNQIKEISSGYKTRDDLGLLVSDKKRPPLDIYPSNSFIEDYEFDSTLTDLDESNSKYISPSSDFPSGTNAYYYTMIRSGNEYIPVYPYIIGKEFKDFPILNNFRGNFNQDIDFTSLNYSMNTSPLNLLNANSGVEYIKQVEDKYNQIFTIKNTLKSGIDGIKIIESGQDYKIKDKIKFLQEYPESTSPIAEVTRILGKDITNFNVGITTLTGIEYENINLSLVGISTTPHQIKNGTYVIVKDISDSDLSGFLGGRVVTVKEKTSSLSKTVPSSTGISTYIELNDITDFKIEDYIKIDNEVLKITSISPQNNRLYVLRGQLSTTQGIHTVGISSVKLLPTRFEFKDSNLDKKITIGNRVYFNPLDSVGVGTTGSSYINDLNIEYYVPPTQIYIKNHGFVTNEPIKYHVGVGGTSLVVSSTGTGSTSLLQDNGIYYAIKYGDDFLGITTSISYPQSPLYFRNVSQANVNLHSWEQSTLNVTGSIEIVSINVTTEGNHGLETGDSIKFHAVPETQEDIIINNSYNLEYSIIKNSTTQFSISISRIPEIKSFPNLNNVKYNTTSENCSGGIFDVFVSYPGVSYKKLPRIEGIVSRYGYGAKILPYSNKIGKIDTVEIVKNGFDYPSDITFSPKLSANTIAYLDNIYKIKEVNVTYGGKNYNTPPTLKVKGNSNVQLISRLDGTSVDSVIISKNTNSLSVAPEIIPINNSNGYEIANIENSAGNGRITLNTTQFPLLYRDYSEPIIDFPFKVGDLIYIENCDVGVENGPNSSNFDDKYFTVTSVNESLNYIEYDITGIGISFGTYPNDSGIYGTVVNKKDIAKFEVELEKEKYVEGELVISYYSNGNVKFIGNVMDQDGWDQNLNQLRIENTRGNLEVGDILHGTINLLEGKVIDVLNFNLKAKLGSKRNTVNYLNVDNGDLSNSLKRIQDSNYYQEFSYAISSKTPYSLWKEPVRSIVHPSGYKEFSDLQIISTPRNDAKIKVLESQLEYVISLDSEKSFSTKNNFTIAYESLDLNSSLDSTERILFGSGSYNWPVSVAGMVPVNGINILPYILNKTNKVIKLKDISNEFNGSCEILDLSVREVTFNSQTPYYLGVSTSGLQVNDVIGYTISNSYPENTTIKRVGINSIELWQPHRVYSGVTTESLSFSRRLDSNQVIGITSFILKTTENDEDYDIFTLSVSPSQINTNYSKIETKNYFQPGQKIKYKNIGGNPIGIVTTTLVQSGVSTNILPSTLYVTSSTLDSFEVSGLSTSSKLVLTNSGSGVHLFSFNDPNNCTLITIDNIIQTPISPTDISSTLSSSIGVGATFLYLTGNVNYITPNEILKIDEEYFKVKTVGIGSTNIVSVDSGYIGSSQTSHTSSTTVKICRGNYNISDNVVYFTSAPLRFISNNNTKIYSQFSGRVFTRSYDPNYLADKNIIFDDISNQFTGNDTFTLKENGNNVTSVYNNVNSNTNINNNPIILVNNIPQVSGSDFEIQNYSTNQIYFPGESPTTGKILRVEANDALGYMPLVGASATVGVSSTGGLHNVYLMGSGSGYREAPRITIISNSGVNGIITATVGASGTITNLTIENPGIGYTNTEPVLVKIDEPLPYTRIGLAYTLSSSGVGTESLINLSIGSSGEVISYNISTSGKYYKVGDVLTPVGIITNPSYGPSFTPLKLTVTQIISDTFSGIYPGQFIKFNDISSKFNSIRKAFDLYLTIDSIQQKITLRKSSIEDSSKIENNFFILINGVIQEPESSYVYSGDRIIFKEAPKSGSSCSVFFFRGSSHDVEEVSPIQSIKPGDIVKFEDSELSKLDNDQFERVVKRLVSSSSLDTFTYTGYGIIDSIPRPLTWDRQNQDRIVNGSLVSKARPELKSRLTPSCNLIWGITDNDVNLLNSSSQVNLYVDNAFPIFTGIDEYPADKIKLDIINSGNLFEIAEGTAIVSASSSISNISVEYSGAGYSHTPTISIGNSSKISKDILYNWNFTSGISTTSTLRAVVQNDIIVSVGNSNLIVSSQDIINWQYDNLNLPYNINLSDLTVSSDGNFVSVGSSGSILIRDNVTDTWNLADKKVQVINDLFVASTVESNYSGQFNKIIYDAYRDMYIAVGESSKIYYCEDISSNTFTEAQIISEVAINNIVFNSLEYNSNIIIAVGDIKNAISYDGRTWSLLPAVPGGAKDILWNLGKFIVVSGNGIYSSDDGLNWILETNSIATLDKIKYYENQYLGITNNGNLHYSFNLTNWYSKEKITNEAITDIHEVVLDNKKYYSLVGTAGTILYTIPTYNYAVAISTITSGGVSQIDIINGGFGYSQSTPPPILIESPQIEKLSIASPEVIGDFGTIIGITTFSDGTPGIGTTTPKLEFKLKTNYYDNDNLGVGYSSLNTFGIQYSQLNVGDYFVIYNSNVVCGHALTGITTTYGGMSNYPTSKIGTASSFIDGVYKVEQVKLPSNPTGIVTIGCNFIPVNGKIDLNLSGITTNYYGNYSWSKIYDFDLVSSTSNTGFPVNVDNGILGIITSPSVYRTPSL